MIVSVSIADRSLSAGAMTAPCKLGRGGARPAAEKREGDGCTPVGEWSVRAALLRPDRGIAPPRSLPWRWIRTDDGWCDAPGDPAYNRPVRLPYSASVERMWRDDAAYDAVLVLGHNDAPPVASLGSAIFVHLDTGRVTEGCVAIGGEAMRELIRLLASGDRLRVA